MRDGDDRVRSTCLGLGLIPSRHVRVTCSVPCYYCRMIDTVCVRVCVCAVRECHRTVDIAGD